MVAVDYFHCKLFSAATQVLKCGQKGQQRFYRNSERMRSVDIKRECILWLLFAFMLLYTLFSGKQLNLVVWIILPWDTVQQTYTRDWEKKYAENNAICSYWKKLQKGTQNIQYHNKTTVFHQLSGGSRYGMEGILPISIFQKNNAIRSCLFAWRSD